MRNRDAAISYRRTAALLCACLSAPAVLLAQSSAPAPVVVTPGRLAADQAPPIIDGLVNLLGRIPPALGSLMRSLQMGQVQFYALAMVLGMLILAAARLIWAAG